MINSEENTDVSFALNEIFLTKISKEKILFSTQSQSKRAWGTFVMPLKETYGQTYDNSQIKVSVQNPSDEQPKTIPVSLFITENKETYQTHLNNLKQEQTLLQEVIFKNQFASDPYTIFLGPFQYESYKKTFTTVKFIYVTFSSKNIPASELNLTVYIQNS